MFGGRNGHRSAKMTVFEFVIPENKEDLRQTSSSGQYVVEQDYSKHELPGKLRGTVYETVINA